MLTTLEVIAVMIISEILWLNFGGREADPAWFIYVPMAGLLFWFIIKLGLESNKKSYNAMSDEEKKEYFKNDKNFNQAVEETARKIKEERKLTAEAKEETNLNKQHDI